MYEGLAGTGPDKPSFGMTPAVICEENTSDALHEKTDLNVLVVVIPKEGLAGWGPANNFFGMTPTMKYYSTAFKDYIL